MKGIHRWSVDFLLKGPVMWISAPMSWRNHDNILWLLISRSIQTSPATCPSLSGGWMTSAGPTATSELTSNPEPEIRWLWPTLLSRNVSSRVSEWLYGRTHNIGARVCFVLFCFVAVIWVPVRPSLLGLYSLSGKTSYRQISWSIKAASLGVIIIV